MYHIVLLAVDRLSNRHPSNLTVSSKFIEPTQVSMVVWITPPVHQATPGALARALLTDRIDVVYDPLSYLALSRPSSSLRFQLSVAERPKKIATNKHNFYVRVRYFGISCMETPPRSQPSPDEEDENSDDDVLFKFPQRGGEHHLVVSLSVGVSE